MNQVVEAAVQLQRFCESESWRFCFIGGLAVQRWSEPRVTRGVDLTLLTGFGREESFVGALLSTFQPRVPDAFEFALQRRVVLIQTTHSVGIDVSLGALPFEENVVDRASLYEILPEVELRTCSAEDLMVLKLFASRAIDIRDAEGIAIRNRRTLDWRYVEEQLRPLAELKEDPQILTTLARLRKL